MASYPVANLIIDHEDPKARKKYQDVLLKKLDIKNKLIKIGKYYFVLSNAIVLVTRRIQKTIKCPACGKEYQLQKFGPKKGDSQYQIIRGKISLKKGCPDCKSTANFTIKDVPISGTSGINIVIYKPENIEIVYNEVTGEGTYYYKLSSDFAKKLKEGEHDLFCRTPKIYIEAVLQDSKIKLNRDNLFHFKMPDMDEYTGGWALPEMLRAFYNLYTYMVMLYTNQSVSKRSLIPMDILFPQPEPSTGAHVRTSMQYNFLRWKGKIQDAYDKWKKNPTEPIIMPVPVGFSQFKGHGRSLLLSPEIAETIKNILASLEVPLEFLYGGSTWSRQNVAVVILENKLNSYIAQLQELVDFVVERVSGDLEIKSKPDVKIGKCKLVEDIALSQLLAQLVADNKLSLHTLYNRLDIDYDKEVKYRKSETMTESDVLLEIARTRAEMEGMLAKAIAKYQARAARDSIPMQKEVAEADMEVQIGGQKAVADIQMEAGAQQMQMQAQMQADMESRQAQQQAKMQEGEQGNLEQELHNLATAWVEAKFQNDPELFAGFKKELMQESTDKYSMVQNYVNDNKPQLYGDAYINADGDVKREKILSSISSEEPTLLELVKEYVDKSQKMKEQAAVWAMQIIKSDPSTRNHLIEQIGAENVPEEFKQDVMGFVQLFDKEMQANPDTYKKLVAQETEAQEKMMNAKTNTKAMDSSQIIEAVKNEMLAELEE